MAKSWHNTKPHSVKSVMRKVMIVVPSLSRGGAERILFGLSNHIPEDRFQTDVLVLSDIEGGGYETKTSVDVLAGHFLVNLVFKLPRILRDLNEDDVVITSQFHLNVWVGFLNKARFIRCISIARESTRVFFRFQGWRRWMAVQGVRRVYSAHRLIIAQTESMAQDLSRLDSSLRIHVIPNPVDMTGGETMDTSIEGIWQTHPCLMTAGRLIPIKDHELLIAAMAHLPDPVQLVIMGDGPLRQHLERVAESNRVKHRVWFLGEVDDPRVYFKHAGVCVVSSRLEGFPNVLLEMMTANGAVVSTSCADGIQELPGVITCKPERLDEMIAALNEALALTPAERDHRLILMRNYLAGRSYPAFWDSVVKLADLSSSDHSQAGNPISI